MSYQANPKNHMGADTSPYPYPTKLEQEKINPAFDKLFDTLQTKETEKGIVLFSKSGTAIPESKWLSESSIAEKIDESTGKFAHQPPIFIRDRASDVVTLPAGTNDGNVSGVTVNGKIYIFRAGIASSAEVTKTVWHEMLHYGLRRFMTQGQYISAMGDLYSQDSWIKSKLINGLRVNRGKRQSLNMVKIMQWPSVQRKP